MKFIGAHIFDYDATFRGSLGIGTDNPDSLLEISSSSTSDFLKLTTAGSGANPIKLVFEKTSVEQGVIEYNRNGDLEIYNTDVDGGVMISGSASADPDFYISHAGASTFKSALTVGQDDTGHDVIFYGATSGKKMQWDESADTLILTGTLDVSNGELIPKSITMPHVSDPSDPADGRSVIWNDTSGNLKIKINVGGSVVTKTIVTYE